jgi:hypothetical protein
MRQRLAVRTPISGVSEDVLHVGLPTLPPPPLTTGRHGRRMEPTPAANQTVCWIPSRWSPAPRHCCGPLLTASQQLQTPDQQLEPLSEEDDDWVSAWEGSETAPV